MTLQEQLDELDARLAKERSRFQRAEYTIKDQYREPGAPFFAPAYYSDCPTKLRVLSDLAFDQGVRIGG